MQKETVYELPSPYRDSMKITAFHFGSPDSQGHQEKACAIIGGMRGNEAQQIYSCARLISALRELEESGRIEPGKMITIIPTVNSYSVNTQRRFWALDNTDINRMFPGYEYGETTQRIAHHVFESVKNYEYGIQFASYYMPGQFVPHIRMMATGYEDPETACQFGLPYVFVREAATYDTMTLNYNWQVWDTKAFSFYAGKMGEIDEDVTEYSVKAVLRFLQNIGVIRPGDSGSDYKGQSSSKIIRSSDMFHVSFCTGGILKQLKFPGSIIRKGEVIGYVLDPYDASVKEELVSPGSGTVFYINSNPFVYENSLACRVIKN